MVKRYKSSKKAVQEAEKKHFRPWSADRPDRPEHDELFDELMAEASKGHRTTWGWADVTGLSQTTIQHHLRHKTKQPKGISLQMWARAMGGRIVFIKGKR